MDFADWLVVVAIAYATIGVLYFVFDRLTQPRDYAYGPSDYWFYFKIDMLAWPALLWALVRDIRQGDKPLQKRRQS